MLVGLLKVEIFHMYLTPTLKLFRQYTFMLFLEAGKIETEGLNGLTVRAINNSNCFALRLFFSAMRQVCGDFFCLNKHPYSFYKPL